MIVRRRTPINNMFRILAQHWNGTLPLWWTFVVNFIPAAVLVLAFLKLDWMWVALQLRLPVWVVLTTMLAMVLMIVIWQFVGILRTLRIQMAGVGGVADSGYVYALLMVYCWLLVFSALDLSRFVSLDAPPGLEQPQTALSLVSDSGELGIAISGDLQFGLTRRLSELLAIHPEVRHLLLSSDGGIVSEARGVVKLVEKHDLLTQVDQHCYSACALVFISGSSRTLGPFGELGFHQYSMNKNYNSPWIDPEEEQRRDAVFMLAQGVDQQFVKRAFSEPHTGLWRPTQQELLDAGVVTALNR